MTETEALNQINEWLNMAKEIGDMNLNRVPYDEIKYNQYMKRMEVIRENINSYHKQMMSQFNRK